MKYFRDKLSQMFYIPCMKYIWKKKSTLLRFISLSLLIAIDMFFFYNITPLYERMLPMEVSSDNFISAFLEDFS